ncbi:MAG: hypothetical protein IV094_26580 [Vitreoscilla sp.]|nr:hypothetical protein [Vitreoscilla sp.]
MSPPADRKLLAVAASVFCLLGCNDHTGSQPTSIGTAVAPAAVAVDPEIEAALDDLERDSIASAAIECDEGLDALTRGTEGPDAALELACELAIAGSPEPDRSRLERQFRSLVESDLTLELALESAGRGDRQALLELALQLEQRAGGSSEPFASLEPDSFSGARAAASHASAAGVDGGAELLARLEAREFPLAGVREEPLWRSVYFRRFDLVQDSIATRRHVAGFANALATLCQQWEPPGIRSVAFDTGLETYLAPVRGQVPGRLVGAVPKVADTLSSAVAKASDGAGDRSMAGWVEQGIRAYQRVKSDVQGALAVGSVVGRDAAQAFFDAAPGCRSPRGLKGIESLIRYFEFTRDSRPTDAPSPSRHIAQTNSEDK